MTVAVEPIPTQSAKALHLFCCLQTSLYIAMSDQERVWAGEHPMAHCIGENLQPLAPSDHGLELLAKLSFASRFDSSELMSKIRRNVAGIFSEDISKSFLVQRETLYDLISLRNKPGGWAQIDALWEHFTGTSLSHLVSHIPMSNYVNMNDNYEDGCVYQVSPTWYQWTGGYGEDGGPDFYLNPLPQHFAGNNLSWVISNLVDHAKRCYEVLEQSSDRVEKLNLYVVDSDGNSIVSLNLPFECNPAEIDLDSLIDNLHIHKSKFQVLSKIKTALGENAYLRFIGNKFSQDLGL